MILCKNLRKYLYSNKYCIRMFGENSSEMNGKAVQLAYHGLTPINTTANNHLNPILIFHGLFGTKNNWKSISRVLASKTGRSVYSFDLRNHGLSPHTSGVDCNLMTMSEDIKLFLDKNSVERATLIGHSLGGLAVMQFAFNWSERVEKLIAVDISPLSVRSSAFYMKPEFMDQLSESIKNISSDLSMSEARKQVDHNLIPIITDSFIRGFFLMSLDKDQNGNIIWRFNLEAIKTMLQNNYINQIKIDKQFLGQFLLICGERSDYVKPDDYEAILKVIPNAKFISIPETTHYLHVEKPNEFIDCALTFINS